MVPFGETVLARLSGPHRQKLDSTWYKAIWLGKSEQSDEHLCGTPKGVLTARTIRRLPKQDAYNADLFNAVRGLPWAAKPTEKLPPVQETPAFMPTITRPVSAKEAKKGVEESPSWPSSSSDENMPEDATDQNQTLASASVPVPTADMEAERGGEGQGPRGVDLPAAKSSGPKMKQLVSKTRELEEKLFLQLCHRKDYPAHELLYGVWLPLKDLRNICRHDAYTHFLGVLIGCLRHIGISGHRSATFDEDLLIPFLRRFHHKFCKVPRFSNGQAPLTTSVIVLAILTFCCLATALAACICRATPPFSLLVLELVRQ